MNEAVKGTVMDLPYPLRLCTEVLHYGAIHSNSNLTGGEMRQHITAIFGQELVQESLNLLSYGLRSPGNYQSEWRLDFVEPTPQQTVDP